MALLPLAVASAVLAALEPGPLLSVSLEARGGVDLADVTVVATSADVARRHVTQGKVAGARVTLRVAGTPPWTLHCVGTRVFCAGSARSAGDVFVPVYPAATLHAVLAAPKGSPAPDGVTLQGRTDEARPTSFVARWPVVDGRLSAVIPQVRSDLRLTFAEYVPLYRFGAQPRDGRLDVGLLPLTRGASLAGRVISAASRQPIPGARLRLRPAGPQAAVGHAPPRAPTDVVLHLHDARADARGFFQVTGLAPGSWELEAQDERHPPRRVAVEVEPQAETWVDAVELIPYLQIPVQLHPPLDPEGQPWRVGLSAPGQASAWATAAPDGTALFSHVEPGPAVWRVNREGGDRLLVLEQELLDERQVTLKVPVIAVQGRVRRGAEALPGATLTIETGQGDAVVLTAHDDGRFSGVMRAPQTELAALTVVVDFGQPPTTSYVVIEQLAPSDPLELDVDLGERRLRGQVLDARGAPVREAQVTVLETGRGLRTSSGETDRDGRFEVSGLRPGRVEVTASHVDAGRDAQAVDMSGSQQPDVTLRLDGWRTVEGRLRSALGGAVPEARLMLWTPAGHVASARSDSTGAFRLKVPQGTALVMVQVYAPSLMLWSACRALRDGPLELSLPPGPPATLHLPDGRLDADRGFFALVTEGGGFFTRNDLFGWTRLSGTASAPESEPIVHGLAPGLYGARWTTERPTSSVGALCQGGLQAAEARVTLSAGGEGSLR